LDLPSQIDPDLTEATLRDGVLEITLLKADEMGKKVPVLANAARA
jgi:HSP20 family molecular chaperone IbpA